MSGIASSEIFLLLIIGLIVLGPKRLPQVANQIGTWLGQARRMTSMMKRQLEEEVNLDLSQVKKSFDINQMAGTGASSETKPPADVSKPSYVHDRQSDHDAGQAAENTAPGDGHVEAGQEEAPPELPDDYSPAHAPDSIGTGVGDDDYIDDDELDPVISASTEDARVEDDTATDKQKPA